jgi:hypothetical protein
MKNQSYPTTPVLLEDLGMLYPTVNSKQPVRYGKYLCCCGTEFTTISTNINRGHTNSCGCYHRQRMTETHTTHGLSSHPMRTIWNDMIARTTNTNKENYKDYGGRGISVCDRWLVLENFIEDMYPTYEKGLSIDRIENNGNYEPNNCRWTTQEIQTRNTRAISTKNSSGYRGVSYTTSRTKWKAQIMISSKRVFLGSFDSALEAAIAYDTYVITNNLEHTINGCVLPI